MGSVLTPGSQPQNPVELWDTGRCQKWLSVQKKIRTAEVRQAVSEITQTV